VVLCKPQTVAIPQTQLLGLPLHEGNEMRREKKFGLVMGISVFICIMAGVLANPSNSQPADSILHNFSGYPDGQSPFGSLTLLGSTLYGMTEMGGANPGTSGGGLGTIFHMNTDGTGYKVLYSFGSVANDGASPAGSLTLSGSTFYGMTSAGGAYGYGTIFQINTDGAGYKVLYSFGSVANDGAYPSGSLTLSGSTLYGTTGAGGTGASPSGTIFQINTDGNGYKVLYNFCPSGVDYDGAYPVGSLTLSGSTLYGMTDAGGTGPDGTIFKINTDGSGYHVLYNFSAYYFGAAHPFGSLTLSGSTLYGMTNSGGANDYGTIFMFNTETNIEKVLYSFGSGSVANDGASPAGSLTLSGSTLYGMTCYGGYYAGTYGWGTIFQINTDGTGYQVLYSFDRHVVGTGDGAYPYGSLTLSGSTLYGMTSGGGAYGPHNGGDGTIFSLYDASITRALVWAGTGGSASIWTLDGSNNYLTSTVYGPYSGWTPVCYISNPDGTRTLVWAGTGGSASIWTLNGSNNYIASKVYGPYSGWTPVCYSSNSDGTRTLVWAGTGGSASIWTLDGSNNYITSIVYGPYSGWTPVSCISNSDGTRTLLWAGTGGSACIWTLDGSNNYIASKVYGPYSGWTPVSSSYSSDGTRTLLWAGTGGSASIWTLDSSNNYITSKVYGPYSGWTPVSYNYNSDGTRLLWAGTGGSASIWTLDGSNNFTTCTEYGPYSGWKPLQYQ